MTGLRKIPGNNKHSVVLSFDIKEASFVAQTLTSHHVCNRGGFFCPQISSHSRIMRVSCVQGVVADDLIPCDNGVNFRSTINQYSIEGIVPDDRSSGDGYA